MRADDGFSRTRCLSGGTLDAAAALRPASGARRRAAAGHHRAGRRRTTQRRPRPGHAVRHGRTRRLRRGLHRVAARRRRLADGHQRRRAGAEGAPSARGVLEYRSTDRAGNVEAARQASASSIDTTRRGRDDAIPGVPLPASPVTGGLDGRRDDVRPVPAAACDEGESIRLSADGPAAGAVAVELVVAPQTAARRRASASGSRASTRHVQLRGAARRRLLPRRVLLRLLGRRPQHYRFSYEIVPAGTDVVPPEVRLKGYTPAVAQPSRSPPQVPADDGAGGSGVARIETSRDDGLTLDGGRERRRRRAGRPQQRRAPLHPLPRRGRGRQRQPLRRARRAHRHAGPLHAGVGPGAGGASGLPRGHPVPRRGPGAVGPRLPPAGPLGRHRQARPASSVSGAGSRPTPSGGTPSTATGRRSPAAGRPARTPSRSPAPRATRPATAGRRRPASGCWS